METTLVKGLKMLEAVARSGGPRGVSELARELAITRSNAHRLLQTLSALGYIRHDAERGQYESTLRLFELGSGIVARLDLRKVAHPIMQSLARDVDENVIISVRDGNEILVLDRIESTRALRTYTSLGARSPMHCTSPGKVLLAHAAEEIVDAVAQALTVFTPRTISSRAALDAELARVRAQGHAAVRSEWREDIAGIAAPIIGSDSAVVAAMSVSGPVGRFKTAQTNVYLPRLLAATRQISERLGYRPDEGRSSRP